jgi:hypothetical protein
MREGQKSIVEQHQHQLQQQQQIQHHQAQQQQQQQQLKNDKDQLLRLQQLQEEEEELRKRSSSRDSYSNKDDDRRTDSPILNLSRKSAQDHSELSGEDDVYVSENDDDLGSTDGLNPINKPNNSKLDSNNKGHEKTADDKVNNNGNNALMSPLPSGHQVRPSVLFFSTFSYFSV